MSADCTPEATGPIDLLAAQQDPIGVSTGDPLPSKTVRAPQPLLLNSAVEVRLNDVVLAKAVLESALWEQAIILGFNPLSMALRKIADKLDGGK